MKSQIVPTGATDQGVISQIKPGVAGAALTERST